ncbi:hypothetical protein ANCCAN_05788 [Ancylostoma caninum]|uniref:Aldehyde dehydrogenase domain-containing protein n=1 Tax=Ancylostoma caninum TaxID=29170 RepID=A0A368GUQ9_ANCCA|nr:hypothetical protein ANCCAN_05788 [Ancylostoma caninum]
MFFKDGHCYSAGTRTFVQGKIYDEFVDRSREHAERRIIGDPFEPSTEQGPQIDGYQVKKILRHVERGKREGAQLITGGKKWGDRGHYVLPTVLSEIDESTTLAREEIIGPIMKVIRFETMEDLLQKTSVKHNFLPTAIMTQDVEKGKMQLSYSQRNFFPKSQRHK